MSIGVTWERKEGVLIGKLEGRMDESTADEFLRALESGMDAADNLLILDFEKVSFVSSAGLRVSLVMARKFGKPGKKLAFCTLPEPVRQVFAVSGFDRHISVYGSRAEAVRAFDQEYTDPCR